ncbi:MAG TPA: FHA domain-containing protein [Xanthomonadales bacterium]|nr:FHA domain-containing protein [Xanthomonadales bacterium]
MAIRLRVHIPDEAALLRVFDAREPVTLGRSPDNVIALEHASVSRHHAVLESVAERWQVRDLGSKNGVRIEGRRVEQAPLASGQWFSVGDVFCEFSELAAGEVEAARAREGRRRHDSQLFAQRVAAAANAESLAAELLRAIVELAECQRGFLVVGNGAQGLAVRAVYGVDPTELEGNRFSGSTGAIDRALRLRRPVFLSDGQDHAWLKGRASVVSRGLRAIVVVPLENEGRLLGAAYADSDDAGRVFTELDAELLGAFAAQASLVLAAGALDEQLARMSSLVTVAPNGAAHAAGTAPAWPGKLP